MGDDRRVPFNPAGGVDGADAGRRRLRRIVGASWGWVQRTAARLAPGPHAYRGARWALLVFAAVVAALFLWPFVGDVRPNWPAVGALVLLLILLAALARVATSLVVWLAGFIRSLPQPLLWALIVAGAFVVTYAASASDAALPLTLTAAGVAALLLGGGLGALGAEDASPHRLYQTVALVAVLIGAAGLAAVTYLFAFPGLRTTPPVDATAAPWAVPTITAPDPSRSGSYRVETYTYGSGTDPHRPAYGAEVDFITESVDGSAFIDGWRGLTAFGRRIYWGFDETALPLNGRVWFPAGEGPFPLVLIVHGNHSAESFSDVGYAYLAELLASRGFIAVSVDENFLNTADFDVMRGSEGLLTEENDARAWILLEHLRVWRGWSEDADHPFFGRVELDRVALVGHSRGGEAAAIAAAFNRLPAYPDDARVDFTYGFGIRSVVAIAPVDGQYHPSGVDTPLEDVNYLALQGAHDADVRSFQGAVQYERVKLSPDLDTFKALLYIYGANHAQFNTTWGRRDYGGLIGRLLNTRNLIPPADQRQIAKVYVSAFLEATLHDVHAYRALFQHHQAGRAWLPDTIYINRYSAASDLPIANFEEDLDLTTATVDGGELWGSGLSTWREDRVRIKRGELTKGVYLGWYEHPPAATYTIILPPQGLDVAPDDALVFSLADARSDEGAPLDPIDFTLEFIDDEADAAQLALSDIMPLQPPLVAEVTKVPLTNEIPRSEAVFQSYTLPLNALHAASPAFNPQRLREIRFVFDRTQTGRMVLDGVALRRREW